MDIGIGAGCLGLSSWCFAFGRSSGSVFPSGEGDGLEEARGEASPKGFREDTHDGFDPIVKGVEKRASQEAAFAVHRGAGEPVTFQQLPHLAVGPFLEMETLEGIAEVNGDIMRPGEAMWGIEDIDASRLEEAADQLEVEGDVLGVEVFQKLVAEGEVGAGVGQVELVTVVDDEIEVIRRGFAGTALVGDVDTVDAFAPLGRRAAEAAIPGGELYQDGLGAGFGKMRAEEAQLRLEVVPGSLRSFAAREAGMVGNAFEKLGVEGLEEYGALLPR